MVISKKVQSDGSYIYQHGELSATGCNLFSSTPIPTIAQVVRVHEKQIVQLSTTTAGLEAHDMIMKASERLADAWTVYQETLAAIYASKEE